jgi:pimeloyl-ACP methyl ester carboxylesterase
MSHASRIVKVALCAASLATACTVVAAPADTEIAVGSGSVVVPGGAGREDRVIEVHYHRPENLTAGSPVVMVMPGAGRNGDDYRDAWIEASERYGVLVLSPSYSETHYPAYWSYNLGNMPSSVTIGIRMQIDTDPAEWRFSEQAQDGADLKRHPLLRQLVQLAHAGMIADVDAEATGLTVNRDRDDWIYADFDRIFEVARGALELDTQSYDLFGHSAGGQILHRFALFHASSRADRILAANSGWYTLPDFETAFPYGLKDTGMAADEIRKALQSRLVVFLGELDDENETRGSLRETPEADRQGPGRLERGRYFFASAQNLAAELDTEMKWTIEVVPGVGHEYRRMADAAAEYLYGERR